MRLIKAITFVAKLFGYRVKEVYNFGQIFYPKDKQDYYGYALQFYKPYISGYRKPTRIRFWKWTIIEL